MLKIIETKDLPDGSACFSIEMSKDYEELIKNAGKEILKSEGVETNDEQLILDLGFEHILKLGMATSNVNQCCGGECEGNCDCTCVESNESNDSKD